MNQVPEQTALAEIRNAFVKRYSSYINYYQQDFVVDLDRLIYAIIFAVAQEPFIRELQSFREIALRQTSLFPANKTPTATDPAKHKQA